MHKRKYKTQIDSASDDEYRPTKRRSTKTPALSPRSNGPPDVSEASLLETSTPYDPLPGQQALPGSDEYKPREKVGKEKDQKGLRNGKKKDNKETGDNLVGVFPGGSSGPGAPANNKSEFQLIDPPRIDQMPSGKFVCPMNGHDGCNNKEGKGFNTKDSVSRHIGHIHTQGQFAAARSLYSQIQKMAGGRFSCPYISCNNNWGNGFATQGTARKHLKTHYKVIRYRCPYKGERRCNSNCGRGWITLDRVSQHIREYHYSDDQQRYNCSQTGDDNCSDNTGCGWTRLDDFRGHIRRCHYSDDKQRYNCSQTGDDNCSNNAGRGFTRLFYFVRHIQQCHYSDDEQRYDCSQAGDDCSNNIGRGFTRLFYFVRHIQQCHYSDDEQRYDCSQARDGCSNNARRGWTRLVEFVRHIQQCHYSDDEQCYDCSQAGGDHCSNNARRGWTRLVEFVRHIRECHYSVSSQQRYDCSQVGDDCSNNARRGWIRLVDFAQHIQRCHYSDDEQRYDCSQVGDDHCRNNARRGWTHLVNFGAHIQQCHYSNDQQRYDCSQTGDDNCNYNARRGWTHLTDFVQHIQQCHYTSGQQHYNCSQTGDDHCSNNAGRGWIRLVDFAQHIQRNHCRPERCHCPQIGHNGCDDVKGKGFSMAAGLKMHLQLVHQKIRWECWCESCDNNSGMGFPYFSLTLHQERNHYYNPKTGLFDAREFLEPPPKATFLPLEMRRILHACIRREWPGRHNLERRAKEREKLKAILISKYEYPYGFKDELGTGYCPVAPRANNPLTHHGQNHDFITASLDGCTMIYFDPDEKKIRYEDVANIIVTSAFKNRFLGRRPKIVLALARESRNGKTREDFEYITKVGRNLEDTMNEFPVRRELRQQLQLPQERVNEINESLRTGQPLKVRNRHRPDSIRENARHRLARNHILKRSPDEADSIPWIRTANYDWEANLPRRYKTFEEILRQEKYREIPHEMVFRNGVVFPFSERSWGIPEDYDNADYQAIIENRAEMMYLRCNRQFRHTTPHIEALILEDFINYLDRIQEVSPGFWVGRSPDGLEMMPYWCIFGSSFGKIIHGQGMTTRFDPDDPYPTNVDVPATRSNIERTSWGWNRAWLSISPGEDLKRAAIQHLDHLPPDEEMKRFYKLPDRKDLQGRDDGQEIILKWSQRTRWRAEPWGCTGTARSSRREKNLKNKDEEADGEGADGEADGEEDGEEADSEEEDGEEAEGAETESAESGDIDNEEMDDELTEAAKRLLEQQASRHTCGMGRRR